MSWTFFIIVLIINLIDSAFCKKNYFVWPVSFIFIGHFVWELINMQLQRIFYHPLRVGDPSLFPYHLQHLAWTFQVVYQTDAFSCKPPLLLGISCPVLLHLHFEFGRKGQVPHGAAGRSLKLDCQFRLTVDVTLAAFSQWAFSLSVSSRSLRSPPSSSRLSSPWAGRSATRWCRKHVIFSVYPSWASHLRDKPRCELSSDIYWGSEISMLGEIWRL